MGSLTEQQIQRLIDRWADYTTRSDIDWDRLFIVFEDMWTAMELYLGYDILSTSQTEVFKKPSASDHIVLTHPNVTGVGLVAATTVDALSAKYTGSDTNARVEVTDTSVILTNRVGATTTTSTETFTDNPTTTNMAAAIQLNVDWTGTLIKDFPSAYLYRTGVRQAKNQLVTLEVWEDFDGDFVVDYSEGIVTFEWGFNVLGPQIRIDYTAGLSAIPKDLELWLIQQATMLYDSASQDQSLVRERLGDYEYERPRPGELGEIATRLDFGSSTVIDRYRRVLP